MLSAWYSSLTIFDIFDNVPVNLKIKQYGITQIDVCTIT